MVADPAFNQAEGRPGLSRVTRVCGIGNGVTLLVVVVVCPLLVVLTVVVTVAKSGSAGGGSCFPLASQITSWVAATCTRAGEVMVGEVSSSQSPGWIERSTLAR